MNYIFNILNLERETEKKIYINDELKNQNVNYIITHGYDFKKDILPEYININYSFEPTIKEIYITLSHIKIFEKYEFNEIYDFIIIIEDDISLRHINNLDLEIEECLKKIPITWEYINLHCNNKFIIKTNMELYKNNIFYRELNNTNIQKDNSTACYCIKISYIKKILKIIRLNNKYIFDFKNKNPTIGNLIKLYTNMGYYYTKPIFTIKFDNINTLGILNPHDYMSNKLIDEYWNTI
jgi:hypothetical protein